MAPCNTKSPDKVKKEEKHIMTSLMTTQEDVAAGGKKELLF